MTSSEFNSEGFDLDATTEDDSDVVYEIGGGASVVASPQGKKQAEDSTNDLTETADEYKQRGNEYFRDKKWLDALDMYTAAIESLPGITGAELLRQRTDWEKAQQANMRERLAEEDERRRKRKDAGEPESGEESDKQDEKLERFEVPPHVHSGRLAILHANRAATLLQLEEFENALKDCDVAILFNPSYAKAYLRRATLHEKMDGNTEAALADARSALEFDPGNRQYRANVERLQKLEDERLEKLKTETMDKLKDLGNSILGNFGLSLNNFQAVQDPKTGSYSISFNQST